LVRILSGLREIRAELAARAGGLDELAGLVAAAGETQSARLDLPERLAVSGPVAWGFALLPALVFLTLLPCVPRFADALDVRLGMGGAVPAWSLPVLALLLLRPYCWSALAARAVLLLHGERAGAARCLFMALGGGPGQVAIHWRCVLGRRPGGGLAGGIGALFLQPARLMGLPPEGAVARAMEYGWREPGLLALHFAHYGRWPLGTALGAALIPWLVFGLGHIGEVLKVLLACAPGRPCFGGLPLPEPQAIGMAMAGCALAALSLLRPRDAAGDMLLYLAAEPAAADPERLAPRAGFVAELLFRLIFLMLAGLAALLQFRVFLPLVSG
jgi:hypothetical protein